MIEKLYGGLDFGTSGARISIINNKRDLIYSDSVTYKYKFEDPISWRISCEELLDNLPVQIKINLVRLAISGTSGTLTACKLNGDPIGEALPYYQTCNNYANIIDSIAEGEEHLKTPFSSLAKALTLIDRYGENIFLRHQSDWIMGWFMND